MKAVAGPLLLVLTIGAASCAHVVKYDGRLNLISVGGISELGRKAEQVFDSGGPPPWAFGVPPFRMAHLFFKVESDTILSGRLTLVDTSLHRTEEWNFRTTEFRRNVVIPPPAGSYAARLIPKGLLMDSGFTWIVFELSDADNRYGSPADNVWLVKGLDHIDLHHQIIPDQFYDLELFGTAPITPMKP